MTDTSHALCGADHNSGCDCAAEPSPESAAAAEGRADADLSRIGAPVLVEVTRGGVVESVHRGRACIVDAAGHVLEHWGDIDALVFPRSTIKPVQAIPLLESGAAQALGVSDAELALACASHSGETRHTRAVSAWLARMGLTVDHLECGPQEPSDSETAAELIRIGEAPSALHNNCSGKHTGMLATALHKGEPLNGYTRYDHPVQQRILGVIEQMSGQDLSHAPWGIDGCSIPTIAMPLAALAYAMARIADPSQLPERRAEAAKRIRTAWATHSYLIAGRNTFDTEMIRGSAGLALVKQGAEGVGVAVLPRLGLGIALKIDDGSSRARDVAMAALVRRSGALTKENWRRVAELETIPVMTRAGRDAGMVRPAADWLPYGAF